MRNEYKQALTTTRDPQEVYKYKTELDKCEETIIEFAYELNDLVESNPELNDLDSSNYKVILQIVGDRLDELDEDELEETVSNIDALFELSKEEAKLDDSIKDKMDEYELEGAMKNKLELSIPIIPLILNYKMEISADITAKLRKTVLKILQLVKGKK